MFDSLGIISAETRPASRTWDQSTYLQHQCQELGELLQDMHIKKPVTQLTHNCKNNCNRSLNPPGSFLQYFPSLTNID